jgi:DNA-binding MarR family transcriptional regulator
MVEQLHDRYDVGMAIDAELFPTLAPDGADEITRLATAAWSAIGNFFMLQKDKIDQIATDLGLHRADLMSLFHLQPDEGTAQRDLAQHLGCDPSLVTSRIDRLEELGLAERQVSPQDRRVKLVRLTPLGRQRRATGMERFARPPEQLAGLSVSDLRSLVRILSKLELSGAQS